MSIYQGDPKLSSDGNGLTLTFKGGQPEMDKGLINAILNTLFYDPWFVNYTQSDDLYHIGCGFNEALKKPITVANLELARSVALKALQWLIDEGAASEIDVRLRNPVSNQVQVLVMIKPPAQSAIVLLATKYGLNWKYQLSEN